MPNQQTIDGDRKNHKGIYNDIEVDNLWVGPRHPALETDRRLEIAGVCLTS